MNFKYATEISEFSCDLKGFEEYNLRTAFRWTFEDIEDDRNFKPRYLLRPDMQRDSCKGWALSFFESRDSCAKKINDMAKDKPNLYKKLGTHIANGQLNTEDGISDKSNNDGHFSHFEYENVILHQNFVIVESLK
jgi:hypothetical protein